MTNKEKALALIGTFATGDTTKVKELLADEYIQHNISIADGLSGLGSVLADGDYVLAISEGTFGGIKTSFYDLFRVENGKIAEHWDVMETIADKKIGKIKMVKFNVTIDITIK